MKCTDILRSALFWDLTQLRLVIPYRSFGTTYRSHLQELGPIGCLETSVLNYVCMLCKIPLRENRPNLSSGRCLKPQADIHLLLNYLVLKAYRSRDTPTSLTFKNCTFCPHCIYVFCIYLRTNSDT